MDDPLECCDYPVFYGLGLEEKSFPENGTTGSAPAYLTRQFWRYTVATKTLELSNGWVGTYDVETGGVLQELHDPFGNSVTFTYAPGSTTLTSVTQHLGNGQTRTVTYSPSVAQPTSMTYQDSSGGPTRTWTFQWAGQPLNLTQVSPPAGPSWQFSRTLQQPGPCYQYFPATVGVTTPVRRLGGVSVHCPASAVDVVTARMHRGGLVAIHQRVRRPGRDVDVQPPDGVRRIAAVHQD